MILVFNVGSSSLKYAIYDNSLKEKQRGSAKTFDDVAKKIQNPSAIGHRIVHGGDKHMEAIIIDNQVRKDLEEISKLAPLHNPPALKVVDSSLSAWPKVANIVVFDTAYYKNLPLFTKLYAIPLKLAEEHGIRRYGFHGISHEYAAKEACKVLKKELEELKIVTIHLGAGCSITAHKNGKAYDTSMGFTPLEGLVMASRSGDLDPGVIFYLSRVANMTFEEIEELLNQKSGLLGISGVSKHIPEILEAAKTEQPTEESFRSGLALEIYAYRVKKYIGAYTAAMGGIDAIIFTGKVGEGSEVIRNMIINNLEFLGNFETLVIETNEELQIAREVKRIT